MAGINPNYDLTRKLCVAQEPICKVPEAAAKREVFFLGALATLPRSNATTSILTRSSKAGILNPTQNHIAAVMDHLVSQTGSSANLALAVAGPALLTKLQTVGTLSKLGLASGIVEQTVWGRGTVLLSTLITACSSVSQEDFTLPGTADASGLPPIYDQSCESLYDRINSANSDSSLANLVAGIQFPVLDVTYNGNPFLADSTGNLITSITPSTPVAWVKKSDKLFILTANKNGDVFAPATLFVYKLKADNTLDGNNPLPTQDLNGEAILFSEFNPTNMSLLEKDDGSEWLGISFGATSGNKITLLDPAGPFNPVYSPAMQPDYCSIKDAPTADGGPSQADAGTDASADAAPADAGHD